MSSVSTVNPSIPTRGSSSGTGRTPSAYSQFFASEEVYVGVTRFHPSVGLVLVGFSKPDAAADVE